MKFDYEDKTWLGGSGLFDCYIGKQLQNINLEVIGCGWEARSKPLVELWFVCGS